MRLVRTVCSLFALIVVMTAGLFAQSTVTSTEKFFGYQLGSDRKMARWDKIVDYYSVIEKESGGRMKVINMGPTMNNNPFLMVIISSAKNMANLETIKKNNLTIVNPHTTPEKEIKKMVVDGNAVIVQSLRMHATAIGSATSVPHAAFSLLT